MSDLLTGLSAYPAGMAQLGDAVVVLNGHDANKIVDVRTGDDKDLGLAAPTAAPTGASATGTTLNGLYRWRVRWKDESTGTISLPSAEYTATPAGNDWTITAPGSPDSRATHWIVERTTQGGRVFYPVNLTSSTPHGTAIATTTFEDEVSDSTLRQREELPVTQGRLAVLHNKVLSNGPYLHAFGGRVHEVAIGVTDTDATVTSSAGFNANMVGQDLTVVEDGVAKTYKILTFTNSSSIELAEAYSGTTGSKTGRITGPRDFEAWSEVNQAEYWGSQNYDGTLSNSTRIGDDGEPLTAGVALGLGLGVLFAKPTRLYLHRYSQSPNPPWLGGDGQIIPLASRRGAFGDRSMYVVDGIAYGMDQFGVWRLTPPSEPVEIGGPIKLDWKVLNQNQADNFHIGYDPAERWIYFFVVRIGETYPKLAYIFDLERGEWVGTREWDLGVTCTCILPDLNGVLRMVLYHEKPTGGAAYAWFNGIGHSMGLAPNVTATGSVTGGTSTTITNSGASFPTSGEALKGIPVTLVRAADASEETQTIISNTGTTLTTTAFTGTAPTAGPPADTYVIGPVKAQYKSGRIAIDPTRKKKFKGLWLWLVHDSAAVDLKARVYLDGSATAFSERAVAIAEDGVTAAAAGAAATIDPGATNTQSGNIHRYRIPCGKLANDLQVELYSIVPGPPWQVLAIEVDFEPDVKDIRSKD